jgi:ComF family protein
MIGRNEQSCTRYVVPAGKKVVRFFEQFLYPLKCLKCGSYIDPEQVEPLSLEACFCESCMAAGVYPVEPPFCSICGVKFQQGFAQNHPCETCLKTPPALAGVRAAVAYKGIIKEAVPLFKYHSKLSLAKVFELLLFQAFLDYYSEAGIDKIIPIPLHRNKLRKRGFNQAFLLVRNFVKFYREKFGQIPPWTIDITSLARIKQTRPQTGFDIAQRKANLKNAFGVVRASTVADKHILLIDDVFTTGTTCNEAARVLLKNRAERVDALVLARA